MSARNLEVIRTAYEALNRGELDAAVADIAADCEYVASGVVPGATGSYRGPEGFKRFLDWLWGEFDDPRAEIRELVELGDQVLVSATASGRGKRSGIETKWSTFQLWTLRDGQIVRGQGFTNREEAMAAAES
jgi:ketosteroid isomerase-like protein